MGCTCNSKSFEFWRENKIERCQRLLFEQKYYLAENKSSVLSMSFRRSMKNFVNQFTLPVVKVREATSNDPWGPSGTLMLEIADLTYNATALSEIMGILWQRLNDRGKNWRHVYKSLTLVEYLLKNGSERLIQHCREGLFNFQNLEEFRYVDDSGREQGSHVREKAKQVIKLLTDENLLTNERRDSRRTRIRMSPSMRFRSQSEHADDIRDHDIKQISTTAFAVLNVFIWVDATIRIEICNQAWIITAIQLWDPLGYLQTMYKSLYQCVSNVICTLEATISSID
ncbi:ENTH domain-containing protein 1 [Ambystoma mexicanum]|uniref:ENTH domain-containing protein 1 n=1 Tax=Ambystoma mexicanum TaxID=8296 RepID=UPI0037E94448